MAYYVEEVDVPQTIALLKTRLDKLNASKKACEARIQRIANEYKTKAVEVETKHKAYLESADASGNNASPELYKQYYAAVAEANDLRIQHKEEIKTKNNIVKTIKVTKRRIEYMERCLEDGVEEMFKYNKE